MVPHLLHVSRVNKIVDERVDGSVPLNTARPPKKSVLPCMEQYQQPVRKARRLHASRQYHPVSSYLIRAFARSAFAPPNTPAFLSPLKEARVSPSATTPAAVCQCHVSTGGAL